MSFRLNDGEYLRHEEKAHYERKPVVLYITSSRVAIECDKKIAIEFPMATVSLKRSKASAAPRDANSIAKLRVCGGPAQFADLSFKGVDCEIVLGRVIEAAKAARKACAEPSLRPVPMPDMAENDPRAQLLSADPRISDMYQLMVGTDLISDEEFWNTFRVELVVYQTSAAVSEEPETALKIEQLKARLFEKQPDARAAYDQWVTESSDEREFWRRYLARPSTRGSRDRDMFDDLAHRSPDSLVAESRIGLFRANERLWPEMRDMFVTLNADSNLSVMQQPPEPQPAQAEPVEEDELPNPFTGPSRPADRSVALEKASHKFADIVKHYVACFTKPRVPAILNGDAEAVLIEMSSNADAEADVQSLAASTDRIVLAGLDRLRQHKLEQHIILFHFWKNYGQPDDASQHKAARLREKLKELQAVVFNELKGMISPEAVRLLRPLCKEMNDAFEKVLKLV
jgi:hypothetical protein